jgi:hypothetical protein
LNKTSKRGSEWSGKSGFEIVFFLPLFFFCFSILKLLSLFLSSTTKKNSKRRKNCPTPLQQLVLISGDGLPHQRGADTPEAGGGDQRQGRRDAR